MNKLFKNEPHAHKHYYVTTKTEFEPLDPEEFGDGIFRKVEYVIAMCNSPCNHVKKVKVEVELEKNDV